MIEQLTPRELDLVRRAQLTNVETARELGISFHTVKTTWTKVFQRLDVPDRPARTKRMMAMLKALRLGFITMSEIVEPPRRRRFL